MTHELSIQLDGRPHRVAVGTTLAGLLATLGHAPQAVATAVNGDFVPRADRGHVLRAGDVVIVFQAIVGG
jgi:sulfur carrier protein